MIDDISFIKKDAIINSIMEFMGNLPMEIKKTPIKVNINSPILDAPMLRSQK
jgi:hypothetical protein